MSRSPREYSAEDTFDLSDITEGADLMRLFIQGGVTHTQLFMLGMILGGFNFSGESPEERRRRKLAKLTAVQQWYDTTELQNDFRNGNGIFLDDFPGLNSLFADPNDPDARAYRELPWMINVFAAPVVGMTRFFESGQISDLNAGFAEGIGSLPYTNELSLREALVTAATLGAGVCCAIKLLCSSF